MNDTDAVDHTIVLELVEITEDTLVYEYINPDGKPLDSVYCREVTFEGSFTIE